ncbi:MAG TPA: DNA repair protein RecO [Aquabacterium sp.]|nr:DNA repair protein RecO [Aquabacterium sp.]
MAASRASPQAAFVLHQWDWSETSLILDLFTREHGRVAAVAKGAKRPYSQLRPVLMPFQRLLVLTSRPKSASADDGADILLLRSAEYAGAGAAMPPARLFPGFYLNELLMKLLARGDPHAALFDAYADALQALAMASDEAPLRAFELQLLRETGVLPELSRITTTQAPVCAAGSYHLGGEAGLAEATADDAMALPGAVCQALQAALDHGDGTALRRACQGALPALRSQLRALLPYHLGSPALRTRALMLDVRRLLDAAPAAPSTP